MKQSHKNKLSWDAVLTLFDVPNPPRQVTVKRAPPKLRVPGPLSSEKITVHG